MLDLFRKLAEEIATSNPGGIEFKFQITPGLAVFPEGLCPFCKAVIRSRRLWEIRGARLEKWWSVETENGKRVLAFKKQHVGVGRYISGHPHVYSNVDDSRNSQPRGSICMGNAKTPEQALFLGMNRRGACWSGPMIRPWLRDVWNHDCEGT
jgi:hypothetical protein